MLHSEIKQRSNNLPVNGNIIVGYYNLLKTEQSVLICLICKSIDEATHAAIVVFCFFLQLRRKLQVANTTSTDKWINGVDCLCALCSS